MQYGYNTIFLMQSRSAWTFIFPKLTQKYKDYRKPSIQLTVIDIFDSPRKLGADLN